jgi:hypothetical protein
VRMNGCGFAIEIHLPFLIELCQVGRHAAIENRIQFFSARPLR